MRYSLFYRIRDTTIVFSGNPAERESWLGRGGIPSNEFRALRIPKPVVHGSDAHNIDKLFRPAMERYCWIKGDPSFEGLRQIIYEPEDRVWIGESPPTTHEIRSVLDSISVSNAHGWFDERVILLNSGLVAIIGLKGSGKTALADLIAFAGGAELDPEDSFIARAGEHIEGLKVSLKWRDGAIEPATIPYESGGTSGLSVKYLSQRFVERLCAGNILSDELQREVESVIFDHLPLEDRMEADDFAQLRGLRTEGLRHERGNLQTSITIASQEIAVLDKRRADALKKNKRRSEIPTLLEGLKKGLPKIDDKAVASKLEELKKLREKKNGLSQSIADLKAVKQQVQDLERKLAGEIRQFASFWIDSERTLRRLGFGEDALATLRPTLPADKSGAQLSPSAAAVFKGRYAQLDKDIRKLEGSPPSSETEKDTATTATIEAAIKKRNRPKVG